MSGIEVPRVGRTLIIDAEGAVLGRLATYVSKLLQEGYRVYVVNIEKAVVSGEKRMVIEGYRVWLRIKTLRNPQKRSPKRPRNPISIFKRTVKGMLPKNFLKGREALTHLKAYIGVPEELAGKKMIRVADADFRRRLKGEYVTLAEIARAMGWKG